MIYLDNAATTGWKPDSVIEAVHHAMTNMCVNAGRGSYELARKASIMLDECRDRILKLSGIRSGYHVYFSPSATIALNELILGLPCDSWTNIYVTPFEHNAIMRPLHALANRTGCSIHQIPFSQDAWTLDEAQLSSLFMTNKPDIVFLSMVSNTTGYRLPLDQIIAIAKNYSAKIIIDCAQAFGSVDVDFQRFGADAYVFAGHKTLYGPYGASGMILSDQWPYVSGLYGGTGSKSLSLEMPEASAGGWEPGSMNITAVAGLNAAVQWIDETTPAAIEAHERKLINKAADSLLALPHVITYLPPQDSRSSIIAFNIEGYESREVGDILSDEFDIALRTGYQCAPLVHDWLKTKRFSGIVRASVGWFNTEDDIDHLINAVQSLL